MELRRGAFVLSLDFELIWGTLDVRGPDGFRAACERERTEVFEPLLALLEEFGIAATWCTLGHLMLASCAPANGRKHPEIVRPTHAWQRGDDWFDDDPCSDEGHEPIFYGRSLVERLLAARVPQEIGCHSFSHVIFGDPGCSREVASSEVGACVQAAAALGVTLRSFAFPRNRIGHLDVLREHGFTCFRGREPTWHQGGGAGGRVRRAGHLADVLAARRPPVVLPRPREGLIDVPGSMMFFPAHGARRRIPVSRRVIRARRGIEAAARERRIMHLWFHPTNLADETEAMMAGLREVLADVADRRERGELDVLPMAEVAARAAPLA